MDNTNIVCWSQFLADFKGEIIDLSDLLDYEKLSANAIKTFRVKFNRKGSACSSLSVSKVSHLELHGGKSCQICQIPRSIGRSASNFQSESSSDPIKSRRAFGTLFTLLDRVTTDMFLKTQVKNLKQSSSTHIFCTGVPVSP